MAGNTIGNIFKITNWGESHGPAVGVIIDGCPSLINLDESDIQKELDRRAPGQSSIATPRKERDQVKILSGVFEGKTTGTPISLLIENTNKKSKDYTHLKNIFRPGHADFTYYSKYGIRDYTGGGRSSARVTAGDVAAGAIAKKILKEKTGIDILAYVKQVKDIKADIDCKKVQFKDIEANIIRCPDIKSAERMIALIEGIKKENDSVGGIIECVIRNVPRGIGDPLFNKVSSSLAQAMFSINAVQGFEMGAGFACADKKGSEYNDEFINQDNRILTTTNNCGGVQGGITNGMPIIFRTAFKPTPTIGIEQKTVNLNGENDLIKAHGRHDPCVLPRAVPVVEAMTAIIMLDLYLCAKAYSTESH